MSRDGSGNYTLPALYNPVITNTPIETLWANTTLDDIASALTSSVSTNGVSVVSDDLPMNAHKFTNVTDATARNQFAALGQVQDSVVIWGGTSGGTANALTISLTPALSAYRAGQIFRFINGMLSNTITNPTININGLGAKTIIQRDSNPLSVGHLTSGAVHEVLFDGTNFRLMSESIAQINKTLQDSTVSIVDNLDPTKAVKFQASGVSPGTTRTITFPDYDLPLVSPKLNFIASVSNISGGVTGGAASPIVLDFQTVSIYSKFIVVARNVVAAAGGNKNINIEFKVSGAYPGGSPYSRNIRTNDTSTGTSSFAGGIGLSAISVLSNLADAGGSRDVIEFECEITNNNNSAYAKSMKYTGRYSRSPDLLDTSGVASLDLAGTFDGVKIYASVGTMVGDFYLYGITVS